MSVNEIFRECDVYQMARQRMYEVSSYPLLTPLGIDEHFNDEIRRKIIKSG